MKRDSWLLIVFIVLLIHLIRPRVVAVGVEAS